ncbi:putative protease [Clostridium acetobutylicum]|uniref:Collagenase family protease n=1 Tax=Clostridium acetobutylicum (strain ATCC 824 / DSM 792 / JCM 1419 / IAM 19013 / LMG 5710 / NBRC 13948 / NRRL B-527 / VKM B-1787 / 2291 / W) TaxID=272562 RepID=Q97GM5_CLOAB|nr:MULTISPECIES: U32 family peptidase [Clostridium]AAK80297.1 Collagenase family protease [Clostridium acetobutylicum ATCC 824]ADZ21392.1 Collagenase family protease [Clostridium acetobutylicum EA 2018]AEI32289.1 collagenase family protease [Clostridium acetobutylicum DSM 1731]AWV79282.1 peptidase [Clostridium acetobutylicum]MBC2394749.1 U32 family peptidase [Clostridium acetobutylicum]
MNKVELLAPAGSIESIYAAVQNGADAVYVGGSRFSARAYAENFNDEIMEKAVDYCHDYGVRLYVTVNTLIKQDEIKEVIRYIEFLYKIGVDALIVQDTAILQLIKRYVPDFEIHASTQMTIHNALGAVYYKERGFKRIVLSRELSLREIEYISKELNIETEVFVHGALCVCYSGQCLMSSIIGGRSGNRGRCAQPCRQSYTLIDKSSLESKKGYFLSTKDMCTVDILDRLIDTGTSSLKIEGRMKKPEYAGGVVSSYRKAIDNKLNGDYKEEKAKLLKLFNREGFSRAYLLGNTGKDMMAYKFPKNTGVFIGKVISDGSIVLKESLNLKDGVRNDVKGTVVSKILLDGVEVKEAKPGEKVKIFPRFYKSGDYIYKTLDLKLTREIEESYKKDFKRKVYLDLEIEFKIGEPFKITASFSRVNDLGANEKNRAISIQVLGDMVCKAEKSPVKREKVEEHLRKTGGTPFEVRNIEFTCFDEGYIPISALNSIRREVLEKFQNSIQKSYKREANLKFEGIKISKRSEVKIPEIMVLVSNKEQYLAVKEEGFKNIIVDLFKRKCDLKLKELKDVYIKVPNVIKEEFNDICNKIDENIENIKGIVTVNAGIINKYKGLVNIIGDYKGNIFNSEALEFYKEDLDGFCISTELSKNEIKALNKCKCMDTQMLIYGKIEAMVSEYCPIGSVFGGKSSKSNCQGTCMKSDFVLKDKMGVSFDVVTDKYCRSHIYNPLPLNLIGNLDEIKNLGVNSYRIDFIDENRESVKRVLSWMKNGKIDGEFSGFTRGSYKRGVE